jgi:deoxyribodipyrimidine photo-lyase
MLEGLKEVEQELKELDISFNLLIGHASEQLPAFVQKHQIGGVICDFSPLRITLNWIEELKKTLPNNVPLAQVDSHNIVPCWHASDKLEYAARTIRNKINSKLDEYLTEFPPLIKHPCRQQEQEEDLISIKTDWQHVYSTLECDKSVKKVEWARPGYTGGILMLDSFIKSRLKQFDQVRNDPNQMGLSNLSPWYHFGQISVQRAIVQIKEYNSKFSKSVQGYMEECIVRRELAENFCFYQPNYDNLEGTNDWAKLTLELHAKDKRPYLYTLEQLDNFKTHDQLWNAAQIQMRVEGKMHGFLRMYWAKKILEWTESPKQALEYAIYLNDRYQLDGRDCAGYVGCMWSICGIHDQGWGERAVFGKIRYMNYEGCKRKFDINKFITKYNTMKHLI